MFSSFPVLVTAVLLPFGNEIITDGLFQKYDVIFGKGINEQCKSFYEDAKERGDILFSLLPSSEPISPQEQRIKAEATNKKVLAEFEKYMLRSGSSRKIVDRDLTTIRLWAGMNLSTLNDSLSLRELTDIELTRFLDTLPNEAQRIAIIGLKRFIHFELDTGRVDWDTSENMLEVLKFITK